jgi:putative MFS transporter
MVARRGMRETRRFESLSPQERVPAPVFRIWKTPYVKRLLLMAGIWFLAYACTNTSVTFFKSYAIENLGLTEKTVSFIITIAALISMPLVLMIGHVLDRIGRKAGAIFILATVSIGCVGIYHSSVPWVLTVFATLAVFGNAAMIPALNAFNTELFPTHLRSDAFAWINNLLGRISYIGAPVLVGLAAGNLGWGPAVAVTAIGPVIALMVVATALPETKGRALEETSSLS